MATKTAQARKPAETAPTFHSIASEMLDASAGDTQLALKRMLSRLNRDRKLAQALITHEVVESLCRSAIQICAGNRRKKIWQPPPQADGRGRVIAMASATMATLLDTPFEGIPRLGNALREQVVAVAERYEKNATTFGHKARWLRLIAQHLPSGKRVEDVLTHERLVELKREAEHG